MSELKRTDLAMARERAVLVKVLLPGPDQDSRDPLRELHGLSTTAGANVVASLLQKRRTYHTGTCIGRGKLDELIQLVRDQNADIIVFDNELTPGQTKALEQATDTKVLDRTEVILDIFASRARTHEARLQVELAQLEYARPRLRRMWTHLSRIEGGIGMRGPGEKQLETDRRIVDKRIADLKTKLQAIQLRKEREVASRQSELTVALVGYTNAGKSTLMNRLTDSDMVVEDKLFATLDTRTRRWPIPRWGTVLLSDTVGFIRDLPHHLVASFKATLEEVRQATLLLHVVDASAPDADDQIEAVNQVLEEIGCRDKPTILVLNKIDSIDDRVLLRQHESSLRQCVSISARSGEKIDDLSRIVAHALSDHFQEVEIRSSVSNGKLLAYLDANAVEHSRHYDGEEVLIRCMLRRETLGEVLRMDGATTQASLSSG